MIQSPANKNYRSTCEHFPVSFLWVSNIQSFRPLRHLTSQIFLASYHVFKFSLNRLFFSIFRKKKQDEDEADQKRKATETAYQGRFRLLLSLWVHSHQPCLVHLNRTLKSLPLGVVHLLAFFITKFLPGLALRPSPGWLGWN